MRTRLGLMIAGALAVGATFGSVAKGTSTSRTPIVRAERHPLALDDGYEPLVNVEL